MSDEKREKKLPTVDYPGGYCRTPEDTRFPSGQPGNPKGRRKGSKNKSTILKELPDKPIQVTIGGKRERTSLFGGMFLSLADKGLKGDPRAVKAAMDEARKLGVFDGEGTRSHGAVIVPAGHA